MNKDLKEYNDELSIEDKKICDTLAKEIKLVLKEAESKSWHLIQYGF